MSRKTFTGLLGAITLISLLSCADSRPLAAPRLRSTDATLQRRIDGWYFGYSEVPSGRIGWFLQLDSKAGSGKIYLPPEIQTLNNLVITQDKVSFQFEDQVQDRFEGRIDAGITGKFRYSNGQSFETHLTPIEEKWLTQEYASFAGLYSNVKFVEEAGDLVGAELLLIPQADGLGGILTFYEGVPGNIYALTKVQIKDNAISLAIVTDRGVQNFTGKLSSDRIIFTKGGDKGLESDQIDLPRQKRLADLFSNQTTVP